MTTATAAPPARAALRIPSWELPFLGTVLIWALLPGSRTPLLWLGATPLNAKHAALVGLAVFLVTLRVRRLGWPQPAWSPARLVPLAFVGLTDYAAVSLLWAGLTVADAAGMALTVALGTTGFLAAHSLVALHTREALPSMLWRLTVVLAAVGALYTAESYFDLGLRGDAAFDFGIDRVRGPLFSASVGHLILLPALGVAAMECLRTGSRRVLPLAAALALTVTALGSGSRAAVLALALFVVLAAAMAASRRRRALLAGGLVLLAVSGAFVFARADPARLLSLDDDVRWSTHRFALSVVQERGPVQNALGGGLGSTWPWYLRDVQGMGTSSVTAEGRVLFHPHSVLLHAGVELGVVGLTLVVSICGAIAHRVAVARRRPELSVLAAAIGASLLALPFDHFLLRLFVVSTLWWVYVLAFIRLTAPARAR